MSETPWDGEVFAADGRGGRIRVRSWGPAEAPAVVFHHGTPSTGVAVPGGWGAATALGIRVISYDRPGYGGSSSWEQYRIADGADWAARAADAFDVDMFAVMGTSGGGPFAAATAALLPERVTRLCICVGIGPSELQGFDPRIGMLAETREEIDAARVDDATLRSFISRAGGQSGDLGLWAAQLPERDRLILSDPRVQHEENIEHEEWVDAGVDGWVNDDRAIFGRPWGFYLKDISVPTLLAYGEADALVPSSHGEAYASVIPASQLCVVPDAGHWLRAEERDMLAWLIRGGDLPPQWQPLQSVLQQ